MRNSIKELELGITHFLMQYTMVKCVTYFFSILFLTGNITPFLYSFNCGEGVMNPDHKCKVLTGSEQLYYWNRLLQRWNKERNHNIKNQYFQHMNWVDVEIRDFPILEYIPQTCLVVLYVLTYFTCSVPSQDA